MEDVLADDLFSLSALSVQINESHEKTVSYAEEHLKLRLKLRDGSQFAEDRAAMAYGELGHAYTFTGRYNEAIEHCKTAIEITKQSPRFLSGEDWPTFAHCHQAYSLAALDRYLEAQQLLHDTLNYWTKNSGAIGSRSFM